MSTTMDRAALGRGAPAAAGQARFRAASRRWTRVALGGLLAVVSVAAVLVLFDAADQRVPVLQLANDVPAGAVLTAADLRIVEVTDDGTLNVVPAADQAFVVGQHAKVRMVAGSLLTLAQLQPDPLVAPGQAVVAVTVPPGELPAGLRERSQVLVVIPFDPSLTGNGSTGTGSTGTGSTVTARVVGLPSGVDEVNGSVSLSLEVSAADAVLVAAASAVRIVLLDPGTDAATSEAVLP